jgi:hypothetical protein
MWQSILQFLQEWFRRPSWASSLVIIGGFLLILTGILFQRKRDIKLGLIGLGAGLIVGILLYIYG